MVVQHQNQTGLGTATPVAIFFEDPNKNNPISVSAGGTDAMYCCHTAAVNVHLVYNENVFCGTGATVKVRTFDVNGENESTRIIAYSTRVTSRCSNCCIRKYRWCCRVYQL